MLTGRPEGLEVAATCRGVLEAGHVPIEPENRTGEQTSLTRRYGPLALRCSPLPDGGPHGAALSPPAACASPGRSVRSPGPANRPTPRSVRLPAARPSPPGPP